MTRILLTTVDRDLEFSKIWLFRRLSGQRPGRAPDS